MLNNNGEKIWLAFLFILMHVMAFGASTSYEIEQEIHQEIAKIGSEAEAIVRECTVISKTNTCRATYQYKVIFSSQSVDYTNSQKMNCNRCTEGETVKIKYLPHNPAKAEMVGHDRSAVDRAWSILFLIGAWWIPLIFIVEHLVQRTKQLMRTQDLFGSLFIVINLSVIFACAFGGLLSAFLFNQVTNKSEFVANSRPIIFLMLLVPIISSYSLGYKALSLTFISMLIMYLLSFLLNFTLNSFIDGIAQSLWELGHFLPLGCIWSLCFGMFGALMGSWLVMAALQEKSRERKEKTAL